MTMSISNWRLAYIWKVCNNVQYGAPYVFASTRIRCGVSGLDYPSTRIRHYVFESLSPDQTKAHTIFYETCIMLVVYMIYDIIVFENLRFGPSTGKWEAGVFKNLYSEERFWKAAFWGTVFTRYVWTGPKQGMLSLPFKCLIIVVKIAKLVSALAIRLAIRASKVATEHCRPPKWKFSFKSAFQKSELARGPWPDQSFWPWNRLFPRVFAKKSSPPCMPCRIWQIWLDGLNQFNDFLPQQGQSATRVEIANTTLPKPWVCLLLVKFSEQWTRRRYNGYGPDRSKQGIW